MPTSRSVLELSIAGDQHVVAWSVADRLAAGVAMLLTLATILVSMFPMTVMPFSEDEDKTESR